MLPHSCSVHLGCAGWALPRASWSEFPARGSHLERYAACLNAVEINSSFYRPHRTATYERWSASVPGDFRFSAKLPKTITHEKRLKDCDALLDGFLAQVGGLGDKLGCLLVQLPPSLAFNAPTSADFLSRLRQRHHGMVALEARHAGWFTPEADALMQSFRVGRILADPVMFDAGRWPGGDPGLVYIRLHGSPQMYYSAYARKLLDALAVRLKIAAASDADVWCIFDNTASGAAIGDALYLKKVLESQV